MHSFKALLNYKYLLNIHFFRLHFVLNIRADHYINIYIEKQDNEKSDICASLLFLIKTNGRFNF
jgi:hypothetical protein